MPLPARAKAAHCWVFRPPPFENLWHRRRGGNTLPDNGWSDYAKQVQILPDAALLMNRRYKDKRKWHAELKKIWEHSPQMCEFRFEGCLGGYLLTPAHSLKQRFIQTKEQYFEIAIACIPCHRILDEKMSHEEMYQAVRNAIACRQSSV